MSVLYRAVHAQVRVVANPAVRLRFRSDATAACKYVAGTDYTADLVDASILGIQYTKH